MDDKDQKKATHKKERLAQALRENLKRRKTAARKLQQGGEEDKDYGSHSYKGREDAGG